MSSEPEVIELDDEVGEVPVHESPRRSPGRTCASPMADLPKGAKFGTLVHAVLETADPFAADLAAELESQIREHSVWWPVDVAPEELAAAMVPLHDTPLGPLAPGRDAAADRSSRPAAGDGLRVPAGRWRCCGSCAPSITLADVGRLLAEHLPADDPLATYAERLSSGALGVQSLKGYLTGSLDVVLRVDGRYLVVDYKTNWLGEPDAA